jgi:hypothetical protein
MSVKATSVTPEAVYVYTDECGQPLFEVVRMPGKKFFQRKPDGTPGLDGVRRVPYRLDEIVLAEQVFLVEGERDAETLRKCGLIASTNPGGASGWRPEFAEHFRGKHVVVLPDQDAPGHAWAARVLRDLTPVAKTLKRIDLPGLEFGSGGDVTDWVVAGHAKTELLALVEEASFYPPVSMSQVETVPEDGARLLADLENFLRRYVLLPDGAALTVAVWSMATFMFGSFDCFAYLGITSPTPRCGKTTLLDLISLLAANPISATNISEAALFRTVAEDKPTLLLDETEWMREKSERAQIFRNLLNAGHRASAVAIRCGNDGKCERFSVYCPKAIACIGDLSDTLADRSIHVPMQRKNAADRIERFRFSRVRKEAEPLQLRITQWLRVLGDMICEAYKALPDLGFLDDRAADNWSPLFALVGVAAPARLRELRKVAETLSRDRAENSVDDSLPLRLLSDFANVARESTEAILPTAHLVDRASKIEDSPWAAEISLTGRKIARWLRPFGIKPKRTEVVRGYGREELLRAWQRYCGPVAPHVSEVSGSVILNFNNDLRMTDADTSDT